MNLDETKEYMKRVAHGLDAALPNTSWTLLVWPNEDTNPDTRRVNYMANCKREDVLAAMKEIIARNEGRYQPPPEMHQ